MNLLKSFSKYTLISIITACVPFILMPVLIHFLSQSDYGIISLFNTYVSMLIPLLSLGASGLISIEYFNKKTSNLSSVVSSILRIPIVTFLDFSSYMFFS